MVTDMAQAATLPGTSEPSDHERVGELIELAGIYFADGAPRTAAVRLRQAATVCDEIADRNDAYLTQGSAA